MANQSAVAKCLSGFEWSSNAQGLSPCALLSSVITPCQGGEYIVSPLNEGSHYDSPGNNNQPVNSCSCSWAAYNLQSMCTACQLSSPDAVRNSTPTWNQYIMNCGSSSDSRTYFPSNFTLANSYSLPYYSGQNPTSWSNQQFNVTQANILSTQGHADLPGNSSENAFPTTSASPLPTSSTSNALDSQIGVIVGSTLGGTAILIILGLFLLYLKRTRMYYQLGGKSDPEKSCYSLQVQQGSHRSSPSSGVEPYTMKYESTTPSPLPSRISGVSQASSTRHSAIEPSENTRHSQSLPSTLTRSSCPRHSSLRLLSPVHLPPPTCSPSPPAPSLNPDTNPQFNHDSNNSNNLSHSQSHRSHTQRLLPASYARWRTQSAGASRGSSSQLGELCTIPESDPAQNDSVPVANLMQPRMSTQSHHTTSTPTANDLDLQQGNDDAEYEEYDEPPPPPYHESE